MYASKDLRGFREAELAAVEVNEESLKYASEELCRQKVVLAAVKEDGLVLTYGSENLRADMDVVLTAIQQIGNSQREEICCDFSTAA